MVLQNYKDITIGLINGSLPITLAEWSLLPLPFKLFHIAPPPSYLRARELGAIIINQQEHISLIDLFKYISICFFIAPTLWWWGVGGYLKSNPFSGIEFLSREITPLYYTSRYGKLKPLVSVSCAVYNIQSGQFL